MSLGACFQAYQRQAAWAGCARGARARTSSPSNSPACCCWPEEEARIPDRPRRRAGMRQLRPGMKYWPAWFDIYPNSQLLPKVAAPVCILHVRPHKSRPARLLCWRPRALHSGASASFGTLWLPAPPLAHIERPTALLRGHRMPGEGGAAPQQGARASSRHSLTRRFVTAGNQGSVTCCSLPAACGTRRRVEGMEARRLLLTALDVLTHTGMSGHARPRGGRRGRPAAALAGAQARGALLPGLRARGRGAVRRLCAPPAPLPRGHLWRLVRKVTSLRAAVTRRRLTARMPLRCFEVVENALRAPCHP